MLRISVRNTSGDDHPFDEYEKTFTYAWIRSLDGLIEEVPASYLVNGAYDEDGCLSYEHTYDYVWCSTDVDLLSFDGAMTLVERNSGLKYQIWKR